MKQTTEHLKQALKNSHPFHQKYVEFLHFVQERNNSERAAVSRKIFSFFFWCFLAPSLVSVAVLLLSNGKVLPRSTRGYLDWIMLIFPVLYSLYFVGGQVLRGVPRVYREGGFALTLGQVADESEWRTKLCTDLQGKFHWSQADWYWISQSLETDIERLFTRARYLTALAGAVFFLIMQGLDAITQDANTIAAEGVIQWVGLALFLVLFYLSSLQTPQSLQRYLSCTKLIEDFFTTE